MPFKTSSQDAQTMAAQWYGLVPSVASSVSQKDLLNGVGHWATQIQEEGSNAAYKDFQASIAAQHGPTAAQELASNQAAYAQKNNGNMPWTPAGGKTGDINTDQYGGSKGGASFLSAANPFAQIKAAAKGDWHEAVLPDPVAQMTNNHVQIAAPIAEGVVGTFGTPLAGAALAGAVGAADKGLTKGANIGDILKGAVGGAATGGLVRGATGLIGGAGSTAQDAGSLAAGVGGTADSGATFDPTDPTNVANDPGTWTGSGTGDAGAITGGGTPTGGGTSSGTNAGSNVTTPSNGILGSGISVTDLLKGIGSGITDYTNQANTAAQLAEKAREFNATNALNTQNLALTQGQNAVATQNKLNTAPLADQSQYMLKAAMSAPPTAFKPRDYTQAGGTNNLATPASGGAAAQLAANQAAAANYTPGAGGVDTSALKMLLAKLNGSGSAYGNMPVTPGSGGTPPATPPVVKPVIPPTNAATPPAANGISNTGQTGQNSGTGSNGSGTFNQALVAPPAGGTSANPATSTAAMDPETLALLMQKLNGGSATATPAYA